MNRKDILSRLGTRWRGGGAAAALVILLGWALLTFPIGDGLTHRSYDLPFALRGNLPSDEVVIIYLDDLSHEELDQPKNRPWDRALHATLIDFLRTNGARAIVFDILFSDPSANPEADDAMAAAIQRHGRVILAADYVVHARMGAYESGDAELPIDKFRDAAAGWGNAQLLHDDFRVRAHTPNRALDSGQRLPGLAWAAAEAIEAPVTQSSAIESRQRWINYYGPPGHLPGVSYVLNFIPGGIDDGFYRDKVVFVGANLSAGFAGAGKDEFATPYSRWVGQLAPGVEIHATTFLNLLHGNWLTRPAYWIEMALILFVGGAAWLGLIRFQPLPATLIALGAALAVAMAGHGLMWHGHRWFPWTIAVIQIGAALFCSIVFNSIQLYVEKRLLEQSLAAHLSPKLVKRLVREPELRRVGGVKQEVSVLFSDVANFTRISESMNADDLVRLMNRYFDTALECIHQTDGTVIKLLGDGIFAVWNAPVAQADHRERACRSALRLRDQLVEFDAAYRRLPLRTRVALHAGEASVGNIGSQTRFDYTAIGDAINLTSRLEGLNKQLGTTVLVTREIQQALETEMIWRLVGHFKFKGFGRVVEVYELIGSPAAAEVSREWREMFADALQEFRLRKFDSAAEKFCKVSELRRNSEHGSSGETASDSGDGPSRFYLEKIPVLRANPPAYEWIGEVELTEK